MPTRTRPWTPAFMLLMALAMPSLPLQAAESTQAVKSGKADKRASTGGSTEKRSSTPTRRSTQLARADRDGSGALSRDEVRAGAPRLLEQFDGIDANHDGELTPQEIRAWSRSHAGQRGRDGKSALAAHFLRADADGNGLLSRDEARAHLPRIAARYDRIDANRDGAITPEEFADDLNIRRAARPTVR